MTKDSTDPDPRPARPEDCVCYGRWQCAACTLALLDADRRAEAARTEIARSVRAVQR